MNIDITEKKNNRYSINHTLYLSITFIILFFYWIFWNSSCKAQNVITVNPNVTYQTITGWEANAQAGGQAGAALFNRDLFPLYQDTLYDLVVNDLGINRLQVTLRCGFENPVDYFQLYLDSLIDHNTWRNNRYQIVNDDSDPFHINWNGFNFTELDCTMNSLVIPIKNRIEANNENLYFHLDYVDFDNSAFEHYTNPEEYAEFVLASFLHIESQYGFIPDALEIKLEPDGNGGWNETKIANALAAAGQRLASYGLYPDFIAPSTSQMNNAINYFNVIVQNPYARQYITELSYHRYGGVSVPNLLTLAQLADNYGINTSMLEWWDDGNNFTILHQDLKLGRNSAWQQGAIASIGNTGTTSLYVIDVSDSINPVVQIRLKTKFTRQYFKFIRSGAVRIEATTTNTNFDPLAFINSDNNTLTEGVESRYLGNYVVVVKASQGGDFAIQGLPQGKYGITYAIEGGHIVNLADITIKWGQSLNTGIPAAGVITIHGKYRYPKSNVKEPINQEFVLLPNYPNPINPVTNLRYHLLEKTHVKLVIFNVLGQKVTTLIDDEQTPGTYQVQWDASEFPSGIYYYILQTNQRKQISKMLVVK